MKKLFKPGDYPTSIDLILLLNRIVIATFMLGHGWGKFLKLTGTEPIKFSDPLGMGTTASLSLAVFAEVFCSLLIFFGLTTRLAAIPLLITMAVAAFIVHANDPFGKKEMALLYLLVYLTIAIAGPGKYSMDNWIYKKLNRS